MGDGFVVTPIDIDTESIVDRLMNLKDYWQLRSNEIPFFTLGKSAYIEGRVPAYIYEKDRYNALLAVNFSDLYVVLVNHLSEKLGEPVNLTRDLAYPGFHIFESSEKLLGIAGNWHHDYPQMTLGLSGTDNSTVTVAIKVPQCGAGLDWIDDEGRPHYLPYREKDLIWHNGNTLHRIAGMSEHKEGDYRITLQGHLIRRNNGMELYW